MITFGDLNERHRITQASGTCNPKGTRTMQRGEAQRHDHIWRLRVFVEQRRITRASGTCNPKKERELCNEKHESNALQKDSFWLGVFIFYTTDWSKQSVKRSESEQHPLEDFLTFSHPPIQPLVDKLFGRPIHEGQQRRQAEWAPLLSLRS
jgi:hypothetical protein